MIKRVLYLWIILAMIVAGCARPEVDVPAAPKSPETGRADVEQIEVMVWESLPALVSVTATGNLPDGCTKIDQVNVEQVGNRFEVEITTRRDPDEVCTQALVPFSETFSLDVLGLEAGTYTVDVNGVTGEFTFYVDNVLPPTPEPIVTGQAQVESVSVAIIQFARPQVNVVASGYLPDGCTKVDEIIQERDGDTINVTITTVRDRDEMCIQVLVPFEESLVVDTEGMTTGTYTLVVNDVTETFEYVVAEEPAEQVIVGEAMVESVQIITTRSIPPLVNLVVTGNLPDGCTAIGDVTQSRQGDLFMVTLTTVRPEDAMCTQALVPFEERLLLDTRGLETGEYIVDVNGVRDTFHFIAGPDQDVQDAASNGALVDNVELLVMESFPVQVAAVISGHLRDACTEIVEIQQDVNAEAKLIQLRIVTARPADLMCAQVLVPFEERVSLEVRGLRKGEYTVDVHSVTATFTLDVDNTLPGS